MNSFVKDAPGLLLSVFFLLFIVVAPVALIIIVALLSPVFITLFIWFIPVAVVLRALKGR